VTPPLRRVLVVILLCSFVLIWPSLIRSQARDEERPGSTASTVYRRPLGNDPATLDPARVTDIYSRSVSQQIFDGLVQFDHTLTVVPALAAFWKASRDGLTWTFTLRTGVRFHHGREVEADDVVYSLSRLLDPKIASPAADHFMVIRGASEVREGKAKRLVGVTALDRHTVKLELVEASIPLVLILALGYAKIVPYDLVEQLGEAFGARPSGTGPFKFVSWDRGNEIVLAANREYFAGPPAIARLVYRIFRGEQLDEMYREFRQGDLEDTPVPTRDYARVVADERYRYVKRTLFSHRHYGFNTRMKPFDDRRVRQALLHAIDRAAIVHGVFLDRYVLAQGILPPGTQGFNPELRGYPYDPPRAQRLLAEAGYPNGKGIPSVSIWSSVKSDRIVREHEHVRRDLANVGIEAQFHYLTQWPTFLKGLEEGRFPVFLHAWFADLPDPDNFLYKLFHSRSSRNFFRYANATVDELLSRARNEQDLSRRVDLYRRAEQLILDDAPVIPFWHYTYERLFQPYVRSVEVNGLGDPYIPLRKIWLDRKR